MHLDAEDSGGTCQQATAARSKHTRIRLGYSCIHSAHIAYFFSFLIVILSSALCTLSLQHPQVKGRYAQSAPLLHLNNDVDKLARFKKLHRHLMSMPPDLLRALHRRQEKRASLLVSNTQRKSKQQLQFASFLSEKEEAARTKMKAKGKVEDKNPQTEGTGQESPDTQGTNLNSAWHLMPIICNLLHRNLT